MADSLHPCRLWLAPRRFEDQHFFSLAFAASWVPEPTLPDAVAPDKLHVTFAYGDLVRDNWDVISAELQARAIDGGFDATFAVPAEVQTFAYTDGTRRTAEFLHVFCPELECAYLKLRGAGLIADSPDWVMREGGRPPFHVGLASGET